MRPSAVTLLALAILAGCAISEPSPKHTAPILLGAVLPFSGGVELYGRQAQVGLDLAASEINAAGGILGHPVEIVYKDDGTRPGPADKAVRELIERDHVFAVIGPITSQNLDILKPISEMHKTPLLYATNY